MTEIHFGPEDRQAIYDAIRSAMMNDPQMRQAVYTGTLDAIKTVHTEALEAENAELRKVLAKGHDECEKCGAFVAVWTEEEIADAKAEGKKLAESLKWE